MKCKTPISDYSNKPHALLRKLLEKTGLAAIEKVTMSTHFAELKDLSEAGEEELALITSKMKGEVAEVMEKKPAAKSMMEALRRWWNR